MRRGAGPGELDGGSGFICRNPVAALRVVYEQGGDADDHDADGDPEQVAGDFFCIEGRHDSNPGLWVRCGMGAG